MRGNIFLTLILVTVLLLNIASGIGLIYITPIGLGKEEFKNYSKKKQEYIKLFLFLLWLGIVINTLYIVFTMTFEHR